MAVNIDHGQQRYVPESRRAVTGVVEWSGGGRPIAGQTYVAPSDFGFGDACKRFADSGMEFMLWGGKYWVPLFPPVPEDRLDKLVKAAAPTQAVCSAPASGKTIKSDGGPSTYYDFLPDWVTLNDAMEYLAENRWGKYALHLKDSMKACFRFGSKEGADVAYDAKKLVYSGLRLLVMIQGKAKVHAFLLQLANDPQFQQHDPLKGLGN